MRYSKLKKILACRHFLKKPTTENQLFKLFVGHWNFNIDVVSQSKHKLHQSYMRQRMVGKLFDAICLNCDKTTFPSIIFNWQCTKLYFPRKKLYLQHFSLPILREIHQQVSPFHILSLSYPTSKVTVKHRFLKILISKTILLY